MTPNYFATNSYKIKIRITKIKTIEMNGTDFSNVKNGNCHKNN